MDCSKCNGYATMLLNMVQGSDPVNLLELHGFLEHFAYYVSFGKFNAGHQRYNAFKKFVSEISEISANDINMTIKTGQSRHENVISINMNDAIPRDEKGITVRIDNINGKKNNSNSSDVFIPYINTFSDLKNKILRMKIELTEGSGFSKSLSDSQIEMHILRTVNSLNVGEKLNDDNLADHSIFTNEFSVIIPPSYYDATSAVNANNIVREKLFESDSKVKDIVDDMSNHDVESEKDIFVIGGMIEKLNSLADESFNDSTDNIQTVKDLLTQLTDGMELFALRDIVAFPSTIIEKLIKSSLNSDHELVMRALDTYLCYFRNKNLNNDAEIINFFHALFLKRPELMVSENYRFIQFIDLLFENGNVEEKNLAFDLYHNYLALPEIKQFVTEEIKLNFNQQQGLLDKDNKCYILLSSDNSGRVMRLSQQALISMLEPEVKKKTIWNNYSIYPSLQDTHEVVRDDPETICTRAFPLFAKGWEYAQRNKKHQLILNALGFKGYIRDIFMSAIMRKTDFVPECNNQPTELNSSFSSLMTDSDQWQQHSLKDKHYANLLTMLDLKEASESDKSKIFFCLSAVFANISHSNVFNGIPDASKTLKRYAFALLAKAHSLDESMISNQTFNTYKTVLLDFNNLSNEEANQLRISSLYRDMVRYAQYRFTKVLSEWTPDAWL
ncbi:TPA: type III secretion system effector EspX2 [Escherichia coli]|nr:type III secretion system effector EspX2 [Escherichia coli]